MLGHIRRTARVGPLAGAALAIALAAAACTPPPSDPAPPGPPSVSGFRLVAERDAAPVVGVLRWNVSDPNRDQLTCSVDSDGDGTTDEVISPCTSASSVLVQIDDPGAYSASIEVTDGEFPAVTADLSETIAPAPAEDFGITLRLDPGMDPVFAQSFQDAAARWSEVITAGVPDVTADIPAGLVGWNPAFSGTIDDVLIDARDTAIDGPGGVLGQAGGILVRNGPWQPYYGIMQFDTADLAALASQGRLDDVILHEMAHVLGVGPSWVLTGRITDLLTDPRYTGPAGVAAWRELGGSGYVPVENDGELGTVLGHWRESVFGDELMTGYLGAAPTVLSRLTVAALADQGYGVDLGAAEPYSLPGFALRAGPGGQTGLLLDVEQIPPLAPTASAG
ncbi:MAG: leishmanolysin-related zinc metalloendopeptidase [Microthrixaceae bacterium]